MLVLDEITNDKSLKIKLGSAAETEYHNYLKNFQLKNAGSVYGGHQKKLIPEAYNQIIDKTK